MKDHILFVKIMVIFCLKQYNHIPTSSFHIGKTIISKRFLLYTGSVLREELHKISLVKYNK